MRAAARGAGARCPGCRQGLADRDGNAEIDMMAAGGSNEVAASVPRFPLRVPPVPDSGETTEEDGNRMADHTLKGKRVAIVAADMVERVELIEPRRALEDAGADTDLISIKPGEITTFNHFDPAETEQVDKAVEEADVSDYDALLIPGGVGNPDQLRGDENIVAFVRAFFEQGKPVAAICHAPWVLIDAGVVSGRTMTSWPTVATDLRNAGANWVDQEVVVDSGLVTSRKPDDIPAFNGKMIEEFAEGKHAEQTQKAQATS
jgi:protease I